MKLIGLLSDFGDETIIYYNKEDGKYYHDKCENTICDKFMTEFIHYLNNPWEETGCINLNIKHEKEETLAILSVICYDTITASLYGHGKTANDAVKDLEVTYKELKQRFDK